MIILIRDRREIHMSNTYFYLERTGHGRAIEARIVMWALIVNNL